MATHEATPVAAIASRLNAHTCQARGPAGRQAGSSPLD